MVKIINQFGDVKRGKQHTVVYQGHYGNQTRRMLKENKDEHTRGQLEQRERFKVGIDFAKGLTKAQRDFIKLYMTEKNIRSPDGLPTTWYSFSKKIAMTTPKIETETELCPGFSGTYANWNYRQPISINNQTGNTLTDCQTLITLTPSNFDYSHCKNDGSDIRFTQANKTTPISYWFEDWNHNGTSKIWVKVDNIPPGANICLYLYFSNSEASDESNGTNTFKDFDLQDILSGGTPSASSYNSTSYPSRACDNLTGEGEGWVCGAHTGWWKYDLGSGITKTVRLLKYLAQNNQEMKDFSIQGSNNNSDWDTLHSAQTINVTNSTTWQEWQFQNATAYRYYRVLISSYWQGYPGALEFEMIGPDILTAAYILEKIGNYYITRKNTDPEPTNELNAEETNEDTLSLKGFSIHHPALKSYEIYNTGMKEENLSNLEDHITTVITKKNLNVTASKIIVKTLADQEYQYIIK